MQNVSRPTTSLVGTSTPVQYETFDSLTTTFDTETRTFDEMGTTWTNQNLGVSGFLWSLRRFPWTEATPWLSEGGTPQYYDKVTDNIIRFYPAPNYDSTDGIKYYFQRNANYFETSDTTKETGLAPELDEYIVSCAALEGAVSLGLSSLPGIKIIHDEAKENMVQYFTRRSEDEQPYRIQGAVIDCR